MVEYYESRNLGGVAGPMKILITRDSDIDSIKTENDNTSIHHIYDFADRSSLTATCLWRQFTKRIHRKGYWVSILWNWWLRTVLHICWIPTNKKRRRYLERAKPPDFTYFWPELKANSGISHWPMTQSNKDRISPRHNYKIMGKLKYTRTVFKEIHGYEDHGLYSTVRMRSNFSQTQPSILSTRELRGKLKQR